MRPSFRERTATDPRIEALKSTTFLGRRFTRRQIADIRETVAMSCRSGTGPER